MLLYDQSMETRMPLAVGLVDPLDPAEVRVVHVAVHFESRAHGRETRGELRFLRLDDHRDVVRVVKARARVHKTDRSVANAERGKLVVWRKLFEVLRGSGGSDEIVKRVDRQRIMRAYRERMRQGFRITVQAPHGMMDVGRDLALYIGDTLRGHGFKSVTGRTLDSPLPSTVNLALYDKKEAHAREVRIVARRMRGKGL